MSSSGVQLGFVLALVAGAGAFLVARARAVFRGAGGCGSGSCGKCPSQRTDPSADQAAPPGFVPVESLVRSIDVSVTSRNSP